MDSALLRNDGFTLIELSIVLVIIGLLVGGVLVGRDLIHSAEIRALVGDYQQYETAYNTFKLKYNCVVGDCANATTFFGTTTVAGEAIRNDNGNGLTMMNYESRYVCQQLGLAGMVKASCSLSCFPQPANTGIYAGINALTSSFGVKYEVEIGVPQYLSSGNYIDQSYAGYGNFIYMATNNDVVNYPYALWNGGIIPPDAKSLDEKIDDGKPFSGKLVQYNWASQCGVFATNSYVSSGVFYTMTNCPSYYQISN